MKTNYVIALPSGVEIGVRYSDKTQVLSFGFKKIHSEAAFDFINTYLEQGYAVTDNGCVSAVLNLHEFVEFLRVLDNDYIIYVLGGAHKFFKR